ncbi:MAG: hypothetical protein C0506_07450 [Anaerolinea sp.]|nr:hypothetical protein [Anaerolinea sp.]
MNSRRVSRRRLLAGGGATLAASLAGAAGFALSRRGGGTSPPASTASQPGALPTSDAPDSPTPSSTPVPRGGVARMSAAARFNFDTFDAQRSGEPSVIEVLGRTHSRLLDWAEFSDPRLTAGLAERWEQPSSRTLTLHLDPRALWHGSGAIAPRPVTADDVVQHFNRQFALRSARQPLAQRMGDYAHWTRVVAVDARTVNIETDVPDPFVLATLAGRFALVQSPESVQAFATEWDKFRPETVAGSGPFRFRERRGDGPLVFTAVRGGHREPSLSGLEVFEPGAPEDLLSFRRDEVLTRDRRDAATLRKEARLVESPRYEDSPVISSFFIGAPPWNNSELVRAISAALNRTWLSEQLFGGRADACGPVSPASGDFALDAPALARYPGFAADAAADARVARALWDTAGGTALGTVTVDFPSVFDPLYSASSVVVGRLNEVLGPQFRAAVETYTTIASKAAEHRYGGGSAAFWFGWGPALLEPDPSRSLVETYFSGGPNAELLGLQPSKVDLALTSMTDLASSTPGRARVHATQEAILSAGGLGIVTWLLQKSEMFRWPYWRGAPLSPFWTQHLDYAAYLDPSSLAFPLRPT